MTTVKNIKVNEKAILSLKGYDMQDSIIQGIKHYSVDSATSARQYIQLTWGSTFCKRTFNETIKTFTF